MVHRRFGRRRIRRGLVVLLLVAGVFRSGAAETARLELEPGTAIRGRTVTLRIRTAIPWGEEVRIEEPELPSPVGWWSLPYVRPWAVENPDGSFSRFVEVMASVRVGAPGFHTIGGFVVRSGGITAVTEPEELIVLDNDEAGFPYPVFTGWRSLPESVWAGQSIPVVLEARNLDSLSLGDSVSLNASPEGLLEDAPGLGGIITHPRGDDVLYDVPVASWVWTLTDPGEYSFPGARVSVSGLIRSTPAFGVEVRPLPSAVSDSGAVGTFRVDAEWDDGPYRVGDIASVRVRVEGEGNINVLKPPVPEMDGASLVGQGSSSSYVPGPRGYEGWREERYDFQIERRGDLEIRIPGWAWVEPGETGAVRRASPRTGSLRAEPSAGSEGGGAASRLLGGDLFKYGSAEFHGRNAYFYLLSLPGFILLTVMFFVKRPRLRGMAAALVLPLLFSFSNIGPEAVSAASAAAEAARSGDWNAAGEAYGRLFERHGEIPGLLHDMAVVEMESGGTDLAVTYMRRALQLRPGSKRLGETLAFIEERAGLSDQVPPSLGWSPSLAFGLWVLASNLFFAALTLLMYRRGAREVILFVSALLFATFSGSAVAYSEARWSDPTAVVSSDADPLRKIPGPLATDWIKLPAGTAVKVTAFEGGDCLVLTGYGLEGWIPRESLRMIKDAVDGF